MKSLLLKSLLILLIGFSLAGFKGCEKGAVLPPMPVDVSCVVTAVPMPQEVKDWLKVEIIDNTTGRLKEDVPESILPYLKQLATQQEQLRRVCPKKVK